MVRYLCLGKEPYSQGSRCPSGPGVRRGGARARGSRGLVVARAASRVAAAAAVLGRCRRANPGAGERASAAHPGRPGIRCLFLSGGSRGIRCGGCGPGSSSRARALLGCFLRSGFWLVSCGVSGRFSGNPLLAAGPSQALGRGDSGVATVAVVLGPQFGLAGPPPVVSWVDPGGSAAGSGPGSCSWARGIWGSHRRCGPGAPASPGGTAATQPERPLIQSSYTSCRWLGVSGGILGHPLLLQWSRVFRVLLGPLG